MGWLSSPSGEILKKVQRSSSSASPIRSKRRANRVVDLVGRKVDELHRQLGDESLEFELPFDDPGGLLDLTPCGDVDHRREHEGAVRGVDRVEADLHGEHRPVATPAEQVQTRAHGARLWDAHERLTLPGVSGPQVRGKQQVDGFSDQLVARVAELPFELLVHQHDAAVRPHDQDPAGQRLGGQPEQSLSIDRRLGDRRGYGIVSRSGHDRVLYPKGPSAISEATRYPGASRLRDNCRNR